MLDIVKQIALLCMAIAVACSQGKLIVLGAVLGLAALVLDKDRFCNLKNKSFNITFIVFVFFIITMCISSLGIGHASGIKESFKYFEKITTFLIMYLLLGNVKNYLKISVIGLALGFIINDYVIIQEVLNSTTLLDKIRVGGFFGNPNKLGGVMALAVPFFSYFLLKYKNDKILFSISLGTLISLFAGLYISGSRGACLNIIIECAAFVALYLYRNKYISFSFRKIMFISVLILVACVMFVTLNERSYDYERILVWQSSVEMFLDNMLFGIGLGNFNSVYNDGYISALAKEPNLSHPHNVYLFYLAETGIVGFIGYLSVVVNFMLLWKNFRHNDLEEAYGIRFTDVFLISLIGMLPHNMVDVVSIFRDQMLLQYYFWGLCCWRFNGDME